MKIEIAAWESSVDGHPVLPSKPLLVSDVAGEPEFVYLSCGPFDVIIGTDELYRAAIAMKCKQTKIEPHRAGWNGPILTYPCGEE